MNTNVANANRLSRFANRCAARCQKLVAQIQKAKRSIEAEYGEIVNAHQQLLHLALNEAEALAWETSYPHLVFPALAREKAQQVVSWKTRQQFIRHRRELSLAA